MTMRLRVGAVVLTALASAIPALGSSFAAQAAARSRPAGGALSAGAFSPAFLGMYRKVLEIDPQIVKYAKKYGVDPTLARAVCMFESGGNGRLTSGAGAHGYFQVMPSTFRLMRVPTNVEAGIKYLSQMTARFGREDYALAAYNGGPGRVAAGRPMPLESLQYVIGVGHYRTVLKMYEPQVRAYARRLRLTRSREGDTWWTLSRRLDLPASHLRFYNPFIGDLALARGPQVIACPAVALDDLLTVADDGSFVYRSRIGDNYITIALAFGVDVDELRRENGLWRLQALPAGMALKFPRVNAAGFSEHAVREGEDLGEMALRLAVDPWQLVRDNGLWDEEVWPGMVLRVRRPAQPRTAAAALVAAGLPSQPRYTLHRVRRGETLAAVARRYGTSVRAIQRANTLGRRTTLRVGERLRIPKTR